ncbi:MAG: M48 family metalloprotease [Nitrospiraceae bacterium]|nr:M48 family metalloprotease [Nitrospiraceae bacterium]
MSWPHTVIGAYLTQSVLHAFVALILVEVSFHAWEIDDHLSKFRYRLLTLGLPVVMFPLFQLISPDRGSWHFRLSFALFDSQRWLDMKVMDLYPFSLAFILLACGFTVLFALQEVLPLFRYRRHSETEKEYETTGEGAARMDAVLEEISKEAGVTKPSSLVIREPHPILYTRGFRKHTVIISGSLLRRLNDRQLRAALLHEMVHIMRGSSLKTPFIYLLRMLMFYNPVSLVEFRRIMQDEEFICDAIATSITGNPAALSSALAAFYYHPETEPAGDHEEGLAGVKDRVETHSHNIMIDERIDKLHGVDPIVTDGFRPFPFLLTAAVILLAGYLVV